MSRRLPARFILGLLLIGLVLFLWRGQLPAARDWIVLGDVAALRQFGLVFLVVVVSLLLRGLRWAVMMESRIPANRATVIAGYGWCFLLLQLLPIRSGEAVRPLWVSRRGGNVPHALGAIIVERFIDLIILLGLLVAAGAAAPDLRRFYRDDLVTVLLIGCLLALAALPFLLRLSRAWIHRRESSGTSKGLSGFVDGFQVLTHSGKSGIIAATSLATWTSLAAVFAGYFGVLHGVPWYAGVAVFSLANLSAVIAVAPGNFGIFEATGTMVLGLYGVPVDQALVSVTGLHVTLLSAQLGFGLACRLQLLIGEDR
ncbi:MAG: flippase-like domain-containing protein [Gammaproteobacteria bacterium]|nr:flippase-like domain-containing protein [Gammaproteobacteria bacterium]